MEILGTHLSFTIGAWRLRFSLAIEDGEAAQLHAVEGAAAAPRLLRGER